MCGSLNLIKTRGRSCVSSLPPDEVSCCKCLCTDIARSASSVFSVADVSVVVSPGVCVCVWWGGGGSGVLSILKCACACMQRARVRVCMCAPMHVSERDEIP